MAKKQNPYQLWLGLHPKLTNPNLFQLLGVDPRSQDEAAIKQKAVTSAKSLLQKLKAVEAKNEAEKVFKQKLHAKIVLAHETMISSDKRKKYRNALVANAAAQKKAAATPNGAPPSSTVKNQAAPRPTSASASAPPPPILPETSVSRNPPVNPPAEIPSAIPMAMPVSAVPDPVISNENASAFPPLGAQEGQSGPNFDNLDAEPTIKVYAKKRKTSRSWVVPIVVLTLLVGGIGGLVSMMTKYSNIFELIPALNAKVNVASVDPNAIEDDKLKGESLTVPKTPHQAIDYKEGEDPRMKTSEDGMSALVEPNNTGSTTKPKLKRVMNSESERAGSGSSDADKRRQTENNAQDAAEKKRTLGASQLNSLRLALQRSRDALFRQDRELARTFNGDVKNLLKRFKIKKPQAVTPEQQGLVRAAKINDQIIGWVDDFWKQVKSSALEMAGGDTIQIGDKTVALVEANDKDIVLRIAGQNERIKYSHLTPLLATTLGEMGSKESVPRWNLAQSAYLGIMSEQYDHLKQKQFRILNQLKIDGYDIESEAISDFTEPDWLKLGLPKKKMPPLSDDQFNDLIASTREQIGYEDPFSVPVDRVDDFLNRLILDPSKDPAARVARLWESIAMIKTGQRIGILVLVNRELNNCCTEVDFNKSFVDPVLTTIKNAKAPHFKDLIARQTIKFVKLFDGNPNLTPAVRKKLVQSVEEIAKEIDNSQLSAMAQQLSSPSK